MKDGYRVPANGINNTFAVATILNQQQGKLKAKDIRKGTVCMFSVIIINYLIDNLKLLNEKSIFSLVVSCITAVQSKRDVAGTSKQMKVCKYKTYLTIVAFYN